SAKQGEALDRQAESASGVAVRIIARVGDDLRMYHAGAQYLDPAGPAAGAATRASADETIDTQLHSGLDEREVVAAKSHLALFSEDATREFCQCTFQIGHAYAVINCQAFHLGHHPFVRRVRCLEAITLPRDHDANGRLSAFHDADLVRRRMRPQKHGTPALTLV